MSNGIIYSCGGSSFYLKEAIKSAESVRSCTLMSELLLFHDYSNDILKANDLSVFDHVIPIEFPDDLPQHFKTNMKTFLENYVRF